MTCWVSQTYLKNMDFSFVLQVNYSVILKKNLILYVFDKESYGEREGKASIYWLPKWNKDWS